MSDETSDHRRAGPPNPYAIEQPSRFFSKFFRLGSEPAFFGLAVPEQVGLGMLQGPPIATTAAIQLISKAAGVSDSIMVTMN